MSDAPEIAEAKAKLRGLVVPAVDRLEELMDSEHAGIRLGAAKEVLDRGGVPAKHDHNVHVEVGLDQDIEQLISAVRRQKVGPGDDEFDTNIEDAILIEDEEQAEITIGDQAAKFIGADPDDVPVNADELSHEAMPRAWWQANPPETTSDEV